VYRNNGLFIEYARTGQFAVVLLLTVVGFFLQPMFVNVQTHLWTYAVLVAGFGLHILINVKFDFIANQKRILFASYVVDVILLSLLIHGGNFGQSLYLFLFLITILCSGLVFGTYGAYALALLCSIAFSLVTLRQEGLQALQLFLTMALHNIAFFSVAGLTGFFADEFFQVEGELKNAGVRLRSKDELIKSILDHAPSGVVLYDDKGQVLLSNPWFAVNLDIEKEIRHLGDVFAPASVPRDFYNEKSNQFEFNLRHRENSEPLVIRVNKSQFYDEVEDKILHLGLFEDLTELKKLEYNLRQNEKMAAVGGLAAGIAHEIRNPLAGISGSVELLSRETKNEEDQKLMKIILREIDRLNNLISEFLDFAKPDKPPTQVVSLKPLVEFALQNAMSGKNIRPDIQVKSQLQDEQIIGYDDKLKQAFLNIVINAFQAMQTTERADFVVELKRDQNQVYVSFRDSGCGMSEETKKRMFEPFHTTKPKGTGLGLAVTHKILTNHKAQIHVDSSPGVGTKIELVFPAAPSN